VRQHGAAQSGFLHRSVTERPVPHALSPGGRQGREDRLHAAGCPPPGYPHPTLAAPQQQRPLGHALCTIRSSGQMIFRITSYASLNSLHLREHWATDSHRHLLTSTRRCVHPKTNFKRNTEMNTVNCRFSQKAKFTPRFFFSKSSPFKQIYFFSTHK